MTPEDRAWFSERFDRISDEFNAHVIQDERRLTKLEDWRDQETAASLQRGVWAGIFSAAAFTAVIEGAKAWLHR